MIYILFLFIHTYYVPKIFGRESSERTGDDSFLAGNQASFSGSFMALPNFAGHVFNRPRTTLRILSKLDVRTSPFNYYHHRSQEYFIILLCIYFSRFKFSRFVEGRGLNVMECGCYWTAEFIVVIIIMRICTHFWLFLVP